MKKIALLFIAMVFAGTISKAQPCSTFNTPPDQPGNWVTVNSSVTWTSINPLDGSPCATVKDASGGSYFRNSIDFVNLGTNYLHRCLCFDYNVTNDGHAGTTSLINPRIFLRLGAQVIYFQAYVTVTEGTQWVHVCAPIELSSGGILPSNTDGQWMMPVGYTPADFDNIMSNCASIDFAIDVAGSSYQTEVVKVDNVCVTECPTRCNSNFRLETSSNTDPSVLPTYYANVFLNTTNPGSTYEVDWGDGSGTTSPYVSHVYAGAGSYVVCVTEYQYVEGSDEPVPVCKTCIEFCFGLPFSGIFDGKGKASSQQDGTPVFGVSTTDMSNETEKENGFLLFPNPSKGATTLKIDLNKSEKVAVRVTDIYGSTMIEIPSKIYEAGSQNIEIITESLLQGVYSVEVTVGEEVHLLRLSAAK